jgi:pimeloyl-ACP methyl ester carboxylesterase
VLQNDSVGSGDPLVLVPGGLTGWVSWVPHQQILSEHHRAIRIQPIPNELGSAGHAGDPSYTRDIQRESLRLTLDELGIASADLAGWSAGGQALIEFAIAYPERVRSLTLIEPGASWLLDDLGEVFPRLAEMNELLVSFAGKEVSEDDLEIFLAAAGFVPEGASVRNHSYWERALPHRATLSWFSENLLGSDWSAEDLSLIDCPVLLIKGSLSEDWDRRVVDVLGERLTYARVVELPGGHASHIESIDDFISELEAHLH